MQLYYAAKDNGAEVPWEMENEWVFTVELQWQSWLFGVARHGDNYSAVWTVSIGPLSFTYYRRN